MGTAVGEVLWGGVALRTPYGKSYNLHMEREHATSQSASHRDDLIREYRLLAVQYGLLDTLLETQNGFFAAQVSQLKHRQLSSTGLLGGTLLALLTVVPAMSTMLPDKQWAWVSTLVLLLVFLLYSFWLVFKQWKEQAFLNERIRPGGLVPLEYRTDYILTVVSSTGTLLALAQQILRCEFDDDASTKRKFEANREFLRHKLDRLRSNGDEAKRLQLITSEDHQIIQQWIDSALDQ